MKIYPNALCAILSCYLHSSIAQIPGHLGQRLSLQAGFQSILNPGTYTVSWRYGLDAIYATARYSSLGMSASFSRAYEASSYVSSLHEYAISKLSYISLDVNYGWSNTNSGFFAPVAKRKAFHLVYSASLVPNR